jgi:hypothetical protein
MKPIESRVAVITAAILVVLAVSLGPALALILV